MKNCQVGYSITDMNLPLKFELLVEIKPVQMAILTVLANAC